ncbi:signal peptide peptidase SppA [Haloplanus rallus]|uniref:Signal peptide peptidase SppA n=1 Tax=Haloplanus rallus TaxID=1816183 RepID=A0A6B9F8F8_9EURY|nr:signal peptide peptidase SppA [Haloplanus rallus]QGX94654.1 signal peptide peptidase SppA [Haloplanus rallus]
MSEDDVGRGAIVIVGGIVAAVLGFLIFVVLPGSLADLLGLLVTVGVVILGTRAAGDLADSVFPDYNAAEVAVEGPITRDGGTPGPIPGGAVGTTADDVVEQIERADEDDAAEALLVKLDTPGGEVVPSDDIRRAAADFDGPTVAYATDVCASGGYWIASGCDELWARRASIVGSIGVIGSRVNVSELADELGVSYERFAAGEYKDAGMPLKELSADEREYLQGIIDGFYEDFVERVAEGRGMDPEAIRDTEARIYLGDDAHELGLVDELGDRDDIEEHVADLIDTEVSVREFEPERGLADRLRGGATAVAYAFGAGVAGTVADDERGFRLRF